ncbi:MAG: hypothetical protein J0G33_03850 [Afipia felis]|nr:hypothetical protein [Afipia felis]
MTYRRALFAAGAICLGSLSFATHTFAADTDQPAKAPKAAPDTPFFYVVDNRLSYSYLFNATGPGSYVVRPDGSIGGTTHKHVVSFTHFDAWQYGTNFISIDLNQSGQNDPANGCAFAAAGGFVPGCAGATELYGVQRSTFGLNQIFDTKAFTYGPLRNVSFEIGTNFGTKNQTYAPATKSLLAGAMFAFDLPYKGYFNVSPMLYKHFDHNSFMQTGGAFGGGSSPTGNNEYKATWALEILYYMDLGFLPENIRYFSISGNATWYGKKGNENEPLQTGTPTAVELFSQPIRLTFDAGSAFMGKKYAHEVDVWVAWRHWENKFGLDAKRSSVCNISPGVSNHTCSEDSVHTGITLKF